MVLVQSSHKFETFVSVSGRVTQIVRGFNVDWKKSIETINQDVMRSFTNFKNGTQILQVRVSTEVYKSSTIHNVFYCMEFVLI